MALRMLEEDKLQRMEVEGGRVREGEVEGREGVEEVGGGEGGEETEREIKKEEMKEEEREAEEMLREKLLIFL